MRSKKVPKVDTLKQQIRCVRLLLFYFIMQMISKYLQNWSARATHLSGQNEEEKKIKHSQTAWNPWTRRSSFQALGPFAGVVCPVGLAPGFSKAFRATKVTLAILNSGCGDLLSSLAISNRSSETCGNAKARRKCPISLSVQKLGRIKFVQEWLWSWSSWPSSSSPSFKHKQHSI